MDIQRISLKPAKIGQRGNFFTYKITASGKLVTDWFPAWISTAPDCLPASGVLCQKTTNSITLWKMGDTLTMPSEPTEVTIAIKGNIAEGCYIEVAGLIWGFGTVKKQKIEPQYDKITENTIPMPKYPTLFLPAIGAGGLLIFWLIYKGEK